MGGAEGVIGAFGAFGEAGEASALTQGADSITPSEMPLFFALAMTSGSNGSRIIERWPSTNSSSGSLAISSIRSALYSSTPK